MKLVSTPIKDLLIIEPEIYRDERGFFFESFNRKKFINALGEEINFVQDNFSHSKKGILRGLHYQLSPKAQGKLVQVLRGAVFDVAVDLRKNSPTFARWYGLELSSKNNKQFWIPSGFAHGFFVLSENVDFLYKTTEYYSPELERSIIWNDPSLNIDWPSHNPKLSTKDAIAPLFSNLSENDLFGC